MKFHVITPVSRVDLLPRLIDSMKYFHIKWHWVWGEAEYNWWALNSAFSVPAFVDITAATVDAELDICYAKINKFIQNRAIVDDDYYMFLCDDDMYPPFFFELLKYETADVIFVSMDRGQHNCIHPATKLIADPANVRVNQIGLEQMIVKGHVLKSLVFNAKSSKADGEMAMYLKANYKVAYRPYLFVLFNFFEKGRW